MELLDIIVGFDYDCSTDPIEREEIELYEKLIGVNFGTHTQNYILNYGYLGLDDIEFYGLSDIEKEKSDLVTQTNYLHKTFNMTKGYIAFENIGDGVYTLLDSNDMAYKFISENNEILPYNINLYKYISERFNENI